jgi:hypothetical protein
VVSRRAPTALLAVLVAGCTDVPLFGSTPHEPAVYLVLDRDIPVNDFDESLGDSALFGLVANLGSARALQYRPVDLVSVTRRTDGAEYDWSYVPRTGDLENYLTSGVQLDAEGNLRMPWSGTGGRLGRDSIAGGEFVDLLIESDGHTITGSARIPTKPTISIVQSGGTTTVHWARSVGAAHYLVQAETEMRAFFGLPTSDTSYVLLRDRPSGTTPATPYVTVIALDANLATLRSDSTSRRAGITGAHGVFGATARDRVAIPPP